MNRLSATLLFTLIAVAPFSLAHADPGVNPPSDINRASYSPWLRSISSNVSAFTDNVFTWYEAQLKTPLPSQVATDPDKIYVDVNHALQETIALEQSGDIEVGNTVGFEAYSLIDVPVHVALETKLFNWGKPVGQPSGETFPFDSVFSSVHDMTTLKWGPNNYWVSSVQTGGGIVQDLHDAYTVLVRGDDAHGYVVFATFFGPSGDTATEAHVSIVTITPTADGKTDYRQSVRQNGQSYKEFGIDYGRKNFGFNASRDRQGVKVQNLQMHELKTTGTIKQNKPGDL